MAASSPWADQPAPGPTAQSASGGVKSLGALALCHKARTLCHRYRFAALEKEEDADDSRELASNEDFLELVGSQMHVLSTLLGALLWRKGGRGI